MDTKSGAAWCQRFPTSSKVEDLAEPFRTNWRNFEAAVVAAGAKVVKSATYRPAERAYLMHWCCRIASGEVKPAAVPAMAGVDIDWTHGGNVAAARAAAKAMMAGYAIRYPAALVSRHTQRRAMDATVTWNGTLAVRDGTGKRVEITEGPRTNANPKLHAVARSYRVFKLVSDPPHFSDDGH